MTNLRIGHGTDLHALEPNKELILGGVSIEAERGTSGHSDGDAMVHAFIDSLLGACGWEDIGEHFPATDRWENSSSLEMLAEISDRMDKNNYILVNADLTVHCEETRLASFREQMQRNCRDPFDASPQINIKFKTADGLGAIGRREAVRADAVSLIET